MNKSFFPVRIKVGDNEQIIYKPHQLPQGEAFTITATHVGRNHPHRSTEKEERFIQLPYAFTRGDRDYAGATVFFRQEEKDGEWLASVARCVWSDQFNRYKGRNQARRNYFKGNTLMLNSGEEANFETAMKIALDGGEFLEDLEVRISVQREEDVPAEEAVA